MKKFLKVALAAVILASSVSMLTSCGSDSDPVPTDVITDEDGIKLSLKWTVAGKTESQALDLADLDIEVYEGEDKIDYTIATSSFDALNIYTEDYDDGTYIVKVYLYETTVDLSYVLTANGISVSAPVTFTSTFDSEDDGRKVETITIKKSGSKYTITQ